MITMVDDRLTGTAEKEIFSTQDHDTPSYVRNADCWAADLDLTSISPWNSRSGNRRAGVLITKRHILTAAHYPLVVGDTLRFVAADGTVEVKTIIAGMNIPGWTVEHGPDIWGALLDSDVSAAIGFAKVLPADWDDYLAPYVRVEGGYARFDSENAMFKINGIPTCCVDQEEKLLVDDGYTLRSHLGTRVPVDDTRIPFYENVVGGDSSDPIFVCINDELVLISTVFGSPGTTWNGPSITYWRADIDAMIATLDESIETPTGYTLTDADLSDFVKV